MRRVARRRRSRSAIIAQPSSSCPATASRRPRAPASAPRRSAWSRGGTGSAPRRPPSSATKHRPAVDRVHARVVAVHPVDLDVPQHREPAGALLFVLVLGGDPPPRQQIEPVVQLARDPQLPALARRQLGERPRRASIDDRGPRTPPGFYAMSVTPASRAVRPLRGSRASGRRTPTLASRGRRRGCAGTCSLRGRVRRRPR